MEFFHGIAVYEIILDKGQVKLNGHYTNTWLFTKPNIIDIEIASKEVDANDISDEYNCTFTQEIKPLDVTNCILIIRKFGKSAYKFEWRDPNTQKLIFNGMGLKAGNNHIAVSYARVE